MATSGDALRGLRTTVRRLLRRPGYSLLAVLTIVLGVGSVTAAYGLLHEVVLRPLPFPEADRIVAVRSLYGGQLVGVTDAELEAIAATSGVFEELTGVIEPRLDRPVVWSGADRPELLEAVRAGPGIFRTLGVAPLLGPGYSADRGAGPEVVLTHRFWSSALGGDPAVVGDALELDGDAVTIVGVLPRSFEFPLEVAPADLWIAYRPPPTEAGAQDPLHVRAIGRLAPGVTITEAEAAVERVVGELRARLGGEVGREGLVVRELREDLLGSARRPLILLLVGALLVLLVASINLAMLVAARNVERKTELRVRAALGAGRRRLVLGLLGEAGVLAAFGGILAVVAGGLALDRITDSGVGGLVRAADAGVGPWVVGVGFASALLPGLAAALLPALRAVRGDRALGSRGSTPEIAGRRFTRMLVATESGLVFVLLVATALVVSSLRNLESVDPGFDREGAVAVEIHLPAGRYDTPDDFSAFLTTMRAEIERLPGVRAAGTVTNLPLTRGWSGQVALEGGDLPVEQLPTADWELAGPGYFEAAGIPLLRGRTFHERDRPGSSAVAVVSRSFAERWWPDGDPVGERIGGYGAGGPWQTVVGVVGDVKQQGLHRESRGAVYLPALQLFPTRDSELVVAARAGEGSALVPAVRSALERLEPELTVGRVRSLETLVRESAGSFRLRAILFAVFGGMALLLGVAGIYGVAAHAVRTRRREIGIRMAVGADGARILRQVLTEGLLPVAAGLAAGGIAVLLAGPLLEGFLFGVGGSDPRIAGAIAALLLLAGASAILPTALRARGVDLSRLLREE